MGTVCVFALLIPHLIVYGAYHYALGTGIIQKCPQNITLALSVSGLMAIFPGEPGLAGTGMSPFWIHWS